MEKQQGKNVKSYIIALICVILAVFLDQWTKMLAVLHLKEQKPFVIIPGVFELQYLENRGAAFGIFQNKQIVFMIGAVLIFLVIGFFYGKIPHSKRFYLMRVCAVLICAGAVGNLIDRLRFNYVVDFFYFSLIDFPIFNVADCYVVVSCFLFAFLILFYHTEEELNCFSLKKQHRKADD